MFLVVVDRTEYGRVNQREGKCLESEGDSEETVREIERERYERRDPRIILFSSNA